MKNMQMITSTALKFWLQAGMCLFSQIMLVGSGASLNSKGSSKNSLPDDVFLPQKPVVVLMLHALSYPS